MHERAVTVVESGSGPYGQFITSGRHVMGADEPVELGGMDTGPDPYELLLSALGACPAKTLRMYATRKKMRLSRVEVRLRHVQRAAGSGGLTDKFERRIALFGDLSVEDRQRQRLLEIADKCPVSQTLQRSSVVDSLLDEAKVG